MSEAANNSTAKPRIAKWPALILYLVVFGGLAGGFYAPADLLTEFPRVFHVLDFLVPLAGGALASQYWPIWRASMQATWPERVELLGKTPPNN